MAGREGSTPRAVRPLDVHAPHGGAANSTGATSVDESGPGQASANPFNVLKGFGSVLGPTTLVTALAFYFGWERTNTLLGYFGVDSSLVAFSLQDYILRGIDGVFTPLVLIFSVVLAALALHTVVASALSGRHHLTVLSWLAVLAMIGGTPLLIEGLSTAVQQPLLTLPYLTPPLSLGIGVAAIGYGAYVIRVAKSSHSEVTPWLGYALSFSAFTLIALSLFWATSVYAQTVGRGRAIALADGLSAQPEVLVYSRARLGIAASGPVTEAVTGDSETKYRYKYSGLRLLLKSGGKYFLLPADWKENGGTVIILADTDDIRIALMTVRQ